MATKVCHLTNVHSPLDHRIYHKQARSLAERGYEVTVVGPGPPELAHLNGPVRVRPVPRPRTLRGRVAGLGRVLRAAREVDAEVYHLHDPELLPVGRVLARHGARVIYDVHEHFPEVVYAREWVPGPLKHMLSLFVDRAERYLARGLTAVVGVVAAMEERFAPLPFAAVRNFPRLEWFDAERPTDPEFELVHVGSLSRERGALFLLEILRLMQSQRPGTRLLTVGGFHSSSVRAEWNRKLERDGLGSLVTHRLEPIPNDQLAGWIRRGRVALIPGQVSRKNLKPFVPTKLFEYMACERPIVASDLPSLRELHALGEWGVLADAGDPSAHAAAAEALLAQPLRAGRLAAAGRRLVVERCNWDHEEARLSALYDRVLGFDSSGAERRREPGASPGNGGGTQPTVPDRHREEARNGSARTAG